MQHPALACVTRSAVQLATDASGVPHAHPVPAHAMKIAPADAMIIAPTDVLEVAPADAIADAIADAKADAIKDVLEIVIADAKVATGAPGVLDHNLLLVVVVIALVHVLVLVELVPDAVD